MKQTKRKKRAEIFGELQRSLQDALAYEQGNNQGLRVTELPPPPKPLTPAQIRAIRKSFNVSQVAFARIINVSPNAVESWEQVQCG
jgi:DNA-binding transcriptional regulator YiaG